MEYKHCLVWNSPSYTEQKLAPKDAKELLETNQAWMLRNVFDWDIKTSTEFWEIINDTYRLLEEHPPKVRNQVRRCLRDCEIRRISKEELIEADGYYVYAKAFERYRDITVNIVSRESWEASLQNNNSINYDYWAVFRKIDGKLIAWALNIIKSDVVSYSTLKAVPEYMNKHYPYFGLIFEMNRYYLNEQHCRYVTDGFRSITEHSNIQPFLEKNFLFRKAYCKLSVHYIWWLKIIIYMAYPLRRIIPIKTLKHLLNFEKISRSFKQ